MKLVKGWEGVTGILMVLCMQVAFTLATRWFRRSLAKLPKPFDRLTGFNASWYSHHLFVIVYALLVVHGQFLYFIRHLLLLLPCYLDMVRTYFARSNWKKVFSTICSKHPYAIIGVFYCGAPVLAQELSRFVLCAQPGRHQQINSISTRSTSNPTYLISHILEYNNDVDKRGRSNRHCALS